MTDFHKAQLLNVIAKPLFHYLGDFCAVLIGERKVRIALDADVRQMEHFSMTAFGINGVDKFLSHCRSCSPVILVRILNFGLGNVVTVYDEDREPCQLFELTKGNADCFCRAEEAVVGNRCRHFAFRENKAGTRFKGNDALQILPCFGSDQPSGSATLGMRDKIWRQKELRSFWLAKAELS